MGERQNFGRMLGALGTHMIECLRWLPNDKKDCINPKIIDQSIEEGNAFDFEVDY